MRSELTFTFILTMFCLSIAVKSSCDVIVTCSEDSATDASITLFCPTYKRGNQIDKISHSKNEKESVCGATLKFFFVVQSEDEEFTRERSPDILDMTTNWGYSPESTYHIKFSQLKFVNSSYNKESKTVEVHLSVLDFDSKEEAKAFWDRTRILLV